MPASAGFWGGTKPPIGVQIDRGSMYAQKLLELWYFNEYMGSVAYGAMNRQNGVFTNGAVWSSGPNGPVLSVSGGAGGSYVEIPSHTLFDGPDVGTVAIRIKIRSASRAAVFSRASGASSVNGMTIYIDDVGKLGVSLKQNNATGVFDTSAGSSIADSLWHNIAMVFYRNTTGVNKLYLDGSVLLSGVCTGAWAFSNNPVLRIGRSVDNFWGGVNADYEYVAWWGQELSPNMIDGFFTQMGETFIAPAWKKYFIPAVVAGGAVIGKSLVVNQTMNRAANY